MNHFVDKSDEIAADLVRKCYGADGVLAAVVRLVDGRVRVIAPDGRHEALAMMFYAAADECANLAPKVRH